jgi:hypothetical protein
MLLFHTYGSPVTRFEKIGEIVLDERGQEE